MTSINYDVESNYELPQPTGGQPVSDGKSAKGNREDSNYAPVGGGSVASAGMQEASQKPKPVSDEQKEATEPIPIPGEVAGNQAQGYDHSSATLEKEALSKVKALVRETYNDPYTQSTRLAQMRKEYLKARYGKDLRTGEE